MDQSQYDYVARILFRIRDSDERGEVTWEIAHFLADAELGFDTERFDELANVAYLENL
jgi:hypothetical protein